MSNPGCPTIVPSLWVAADEYTECQQIRCLVEAPQSWTQAPEDDELRRKSFVVCTLTVDFALLVQDEHADQGRIDSLDENGHRRFRELVGRCLDAHGLQVGDDVMRQMARAWYEAGPPWIEFFDVHELSPGAKRVCI